MLRYFFRYRSSPRPFLKLEGFKGPECALTVTGQNRRRAAYVQFKTPAAVSGGPSLELQLRLDRGQLFPWMEAFRAAQLTLTQVTLSDADLNLGKRSIRPIIAQTPNFAGFTWLV